MNTSRAFTSVMATTRRPRATGRRRCNIRPPAAIPAASSPILTARPAGRTTRSTNSIPSRTVGARRRASPWAARWTRSVISVRHDRFGTLQPAQPGLQSSGHDQREAESRSVRSHRQPGVERLWRHAGRLRLPVQPARRRREQAEPAAKNSPIKKKIIKYLYRKFLFSHISLAIINTFLL